MYESLIKLIEDECLLVDTYDTFSMKHIVDLFVTKNKIKLDSPGWFYLVSELWCELRFIRNQFDGIEEFEFALRDGV